MGSRSGFGQPAFKISRAEIPHFLCESLSCCSGNRITSELSSCGCSTRPGRRVINVRHRMCLSGPAPLFMYYHLATRFSIRYLDTNSRAAEIASLIITFSQGNTLTSNSLALDRYRHFVFILLKFARPNKFSRILRYRGHFSGSLLGVCCGKTAAARLLPASEEATAR